MRDITRSEREGLRRISSADAATCIHSPFAHVRYNGRALIDHKLPDRGEDLYNQLIVTPGGETLVLLTLADFEALRARGDAAKRAHALEARAALAPDERRALAEAKTPLAYWRRRRGLTQAQLATRLDLSQSYIAALEAGDRRGDAALVKRLSAILDLPMEALVA